MPVKPVVRKSKQIPKKPAAKQAWADFSRPFKKSLDGLVYLMTHFGRYGQDIFSVLLVMFSLLSLLAIMGVTGGVILTPWADFLTRWFGWGAPVLILATGLLGLTGFKRLKLQGGFVFRIVVVESLIFSLVAFMACLSGFSLDKAEDGMFGGLLGWGLADLLRKPLGEFWSSVIWFAMLAIFAVITSGFFQRKAAAPLAREGEREKSIRRVKVAEKLEPVQEELPFEDPPVKQRPVKPVQTKPVEPFLPEKPEKLEKPTTIPVKHPAAQPPKKLQNLGAMALQSKTDAEKKPLPPVNRDGSLPPLSILQEEQVIRMDETTINQSAAILEKTLLDFGVPARVIGYRIGPTVTQFAVEPGYIEKPAPDGQVLKQKVRVNQISTLSRDLSLALSSTSIRIEAPVPGRSYVGVEIPNIRTMTVRLKPILESEKFTKLNAPLALALGRDVSGLPLAADLGRMPHMLIAGTTGSGKSICIAAIAACLAMNNSPQKLRLVMIDPKMVELTRFNGLPHLLGKVETQMDRVQGVLKWVISEMDQRYKAFAEVHARDLEAYNKKLEKRGDEPLPRIVLIIDELADLMMTAATTTEPAIVRLAQLARATGIHLIVATQRPSTDVVTGLIKANFPARIAFAVTSNTDSRVILDTPGAENLLGRGDMLFLNPEAGTPVRAQGVFVSDDEIDKIIEHWKNELPDMRESGSPWEQILEEQEEGGDALVQEAIEVIKQTGKASASLLQRRLRIGYPRAASLIDELEDMGIVGPPNGSGREREVLIIDEEDIPEE
jgi:S-DNA-T family DNA segregation ATPase FtsK/SpoIIIE